MTGDENQIAIFDAGFRPLQVVVEMDGLVVLVDTEEGDVQVIAREGEVVGIAAKKCRIKFRRKYEAHVGVLLVLVEVVNFARVERNHVAAEASRGCAILFDGAHCGALCLARVGSRHGCRGSGFHFRGDVVDADQHVQFKIGTLCFFGMGLGVKTGLHVVVAGSGEFPNAVGAHVMIGKCQAVGRHERAGASIIKAHRRQAQVIQPLLGRQKAVLLLDPIFREGVV